MLFGEQYTTTKEPEYKTAEELNLSTHFETDKTIDEITNNVGGYSWEVDFYNQLITSADASTTLDTNVTQAIQRYRKIDSLEIKLTSPITSSTIEDIEGEAYVNIGSAIYKHDLFTAKMRDNRIGIFTIEEVNGKTYELNQIISIKFKILGFADTEHSLYQNLLSKVDTEYIHDIGFKKHNGSPIIAKKEYLNHNIVLENCIVHMTNYLAKFLDVDNNLIAINLNGRLLVDPFLNDFILSVFSTRELSMLENVNRVESNFNREDIPTLFKSIVGNLDLKYANKLYFNYTNNDPYLKNYLNVFYTVGTKDTGLLINDQTYFLEDSFYTLDGDNTELSKFDTILVKFIEKKDYPSIDEIEECIEEVLASGDLNVYFKLPILIMIYKQTSYIYKG